MSDRPSDDGGSARSDAASRLAALLADVVDDPAPPAPSPRDPGADAPVARRVVRRRDLVEPPAADPAPPADPDATQPIATVPAPPAPPATDAEDAAAARERQREEEVLAEARAFVRAGAAAPPAPLRKQPGKPWSRPVAPPPPVVAEPEPEPEPTPEPEPAPTPPPARRRAAAPPPVVVDDGGGDDDRDDAEDDGGADDGGAGRVPRLTLRAVAFGLSLALLMGAVPVLGWVGSQRLLDSKGGEVVEGGTDADEPGYRTLVNPTPTALVVHRDAEGYPVSAAILAQGAGETGGTVLLVPLGLQPVEGSYFNRIIDGYDSVRSDDGFRRSIEDVIGISVPPPVIDVTDESLATLVAPVAPLELDVTDPVMDDAGVVYEGQVRLAADQVGPYLRATREGEPEIAHLERIRDVWVAWLAAIGDATATEPIGAAATGMGSYLRVLAAGEPVVETLDVEDGIPTSYGQAPFYVPAAGMNEQIIDAVPFPVSPREGRRFTIKLLNGAAGELLPMALMRDLVLADGSLVWLGNASAFGQEETLIEYRDEDGREDAEAVQELLGEGVEIDQMSTRRAEAEREDLVITIGSDVLSRYEE